MIVGAVAWVVACAILPAAAARDLSWRFVGLNGLREKRELTTLQEVMGLPEFAGMRSNLTVRVAAALAKQTSQKAEPDAELRRLFLPMAEDLVAHQTVYELKAAGTSSAWTLAIQLPLERHQVWAANWEKISKHARAGAGTLSREGQWSVLGTGSAKGILEKTKEPMREILAASGDISFLGDYLPGFKPSRGELHVKSQGKSIRSEGKFHFAEDLPFKLTKWEIPTNTIREPLLAFTAAQGVGERLAGHGAFKKHPAPSQLFVWSEGSSPFSTYVAGKVGDAAGFVRDFATGINLAEAGKKMVGQLQYNTNQNALYLTGLPVAVPFLKPAHPGDLNFVFGGVMPLSEFAGSPMPAELARELTSRTNLVYYDWEITGARGSHIRPISQFAALAVRRTIAEFQDPASKWWVAAEPKLHNTITEITQSGPRELALVRSSETGFSAVELYAMTQWIAGPPAVGLGEVPKAPAPAPATAP